MANLLTSERQALLRRALWARLALALSLSLILCALVAGAALLPSYLAATTDQSPDLSSAALPPSSAVDKTTLLATRTLVDTLVPLISATTTPTEAISAALEGEPSGAQLDHVAYTAGVNGAGQVILEGVAQSPTQIGAYRDALSQNTHFHTVSVPISSLIGAEDGRFSITLSGNF